MKYVPPVGGADNDPYIDGNPSTGVEGSAVPAAAIEDPMRELVAVIVAAGLTPDDGQLNQVLLALQAMMPQFSDQTGLLDVNGWATIPLKIAGVKRKLIIQWGRIVIAASSSATFTYPVAFPNAMLAHYAVNATPTYNPANTPFVGISPTGTPLVSAMVQNGYSLSTNGIDILAIGW